MKLKLFGVDFVEDTVTFSVPHDIMEKATWMAGFANIDLSEISDIEAAPQSVIEDEQVVICNGCERDINYCLCDAFKQAGQ